MARKRRARRRRNPGFEGRKAKRLRSMLVRIGLTRSGWDGSVPKSTLKWIAKKTREAIALRRNGRRRRRR